jgi:hypothetical protein
MEQVCCGEGTLRLIEFDHRDSGGGVDEGLLIDASHSFEGSNREGVLGTEITRMFSFNLTLCLLLLFCLLQGFELR